MRVRFLTGLLVLSFISPTLAHTNHSNLLPLARLAVSADASEAEAAIHELRSQGPAGFAAFLAAIVPAHRAATLQPMRALRTE